MRCVLLFCLVFSFSCFANSHPHHGATRIGLYRIIQDSHLRCLIGCAERLCAYPIQSYLRALLSPFLFKQSLDCILFNPQYSLIKKDRYTPVQWPFYLHTLPSICCCDSRHCFNCDGAICTLCKNILQRQPFFIIKKSPHTTFFNNL